MKCERCRLTDAGRNDIYCRPCRVAVDDLSASIIGVPSSRALETLVKPSLLVSLIIVAVSLCGCSRRYDESADAARWRDGRSYENTPHQDVSLARLAEDVHRIADALERAFPDQQLIRAKMAVPADAMRAMEDLLKSAASPAAPK